MRCILLLRKTLTATIAEIHRVQAENIISDHHVGVLRLFSSERCRADEAERARDYALADLKAARISAETQVAEQLARCAEMQAIADVQASEHLTAINDQTARNAELEHKQGEAERDAAGREQADRGPGRLVLGGLMGLIDRVLNKAQFRRAPARPNQVHMAVTDNCFLPCLHCDIWKNDTPDLEEAVWADLIDRLAAWCAPAGMNFVGGEPLLRKDLERLMARAVSSGFEVSFNTNGWLVTPKRAQAISDAGVSIAYVSLDGIDAETVDHSRGRKGSFDKAMKAIDLFDALPGPRVVIAAIMHTS